MPARRQTSNNRTTKLDEALASLVQTQAVLSHNQAVLQAMITENRRDIARRDTVLEEIMAILQRHERMLAELPEAIREKIGFKRRQN